MSDVATTARFPAEDRIGVLEELLNQRYSVRAFLPRPVPRETIEHVVRVAQRTASWCNSQPWQVIIASGEAKERFRQLIYKEASGGLGDDYDFTPPREYVGVYLERRRESGFQLYNTLGIARGDKMKAHEVSGERLQERAFIADVEDLRDRGILTDDQVQRARSKSQPITSARPSPDDDVAELEVLRERGILTDEEYKSAKQRALAA